MSQPSRSVVWRLKLSESKRLWSSLQSHEKNSSRYIFVITKFRNTLCPDLTTIKGDLIHGVCSLLTKADGKQTTHPPLLERENIVVNVMSKFVALNLQIKNTDADFPNKITLHKILHDILASLEYCPNSIAFLFYRAIRRHWLKSRAVSLGDSL